MSLQSTTALKKRDIYSVIVCLLINDNVSNCVYHHYHHKILKVTSIKAFPYRHLQLCFVLPRSQFPLGWYCKVNSGRIIFFHHCHIYFPIGWRLELYRALLIVWIHGYSFVGQVWLHLRIFLLISMLIAIYLRILHLTTYRWSADCFI